MRRATSRFSSELAVAYTNAPRCFASWIAAEPTPPDPACTKTLSPRTIETSGMYAVRYVVRNAAPDANDAAAGRSNTHCGSTSKRAAYQPPHADQAHTRRQPSSPAISFPSTYGNSGICGYNPRRINTSAKLTPEARTSTTTPDGLSH